ncbi:MAG: deoxyribodipyrimidine photolyase [Spirochaetae bacterium HGW-Spirochaetae-7]|nr:MAG: deoxyribodipyrimidine photolyase [Spirochaetae bacterium HGW-Spirochaetae-7]
MIETERIRHLNDRRVTAGAGFVLYWMQAAQRAIDNQALSHAALEADRLGLPLEVLFVLADYPAATVPHYRWMLGGLRECSSTLRDAGIGFSIVRGDPLAMVTNAAIGAAMVVCDRSPSGWSVRLRASLAASLDIPVVEVDGESVVPEAVASSRQEWSARTFRGRISGAVDVYATTPPLPVPVPRRAAGTAGMAGDDKLFSAYDSPMAHAYSGDRSPLQSFAAVSGTSAALVLLERFVLERLDRYDADRNDPTKDGTSGLSPYLHFGQLSPVAVIRAAKTAGGPGYPAFAEQVVVRRELCRNYARWHPLDVDSWEGIPSWSRSTLEAAARDRRAYVYTRANFEASLTHDAYWNAPQEQLVRTGTIHNYMRMYWGKMMLAWSASPREAFETAVYLNDRYALDGRDPNGWAGVAWCFGLHDRPWPPRPVFGTVRAMAASGLRRKFDADGYAATWAPDHLPKSALESTIP